MKGQYWEAAQDVFGDTGINITSHGREYLGSVIGSPDFCEEFVKEKVEEWTCEIKILAPFAKTHPHAAYATHTHGLRHKWKFLLRMVSGLENLHAVTSRSCNS